MSSPINWRTYAGRWVAIDQRTGSVAGVGDSAENALILAQRNRPKERFTTRFVLSLPQLYFDLRPYLLAHSQPVYLVGGAVRDALLGRPCHDLDFATPSGGIRLAFALADAFDGAAYALDRERGIGRAVLPRGDIIDVADLRGASLEADLKDRDFALNALALPVTGETADTLIDPCGGQQALADGLLTLCSAESIARDPVRTLRAVRMGQQFELTLTEPVKAAVSAEVERLGESSAERIRDELLKLLSGRRPDEALDQLRTLGLLDKLLPMVAVLEPVTQSPPHFETVGGHTRSVLRWVAKIERMLREDSAELGVLADFRPQLLLHFGRTVDGDLRGWQLLRLSALFHDTGKADCRSVDDDGRIRFLGHETVSAEHATTRLTALKLSNAAIEHVAQTVAAHMRPLQLAQSVPASRRAIFRYFRATGLAGVDTAIHALADSAAKFDGLTADPDLLQLVGQLLHAYFTTPEQSVRPTRLLDGHELMDLLQLAPGPEIGRMLRLLEEAQAVGQVTTRDEAIAFVRQTHL